MSNEREKVIERVAHALCMLKARDLYESDLTYHRRQVAALYDAGLLSTQDHVDALKACEEYRRVWGRDHVAPPYGCLGAVYEVGARSLASKAAAQESPLDRVKELEKWLKHIAKLPCIQSYLKESRPCARYECAPCIAMKAMSTLSKSASFGEGE